MAQSPFVGKRLVTVFGGSGFIGRYVVRALARRGWRVRVAVRRPDLAGFLAPLGDVGQIHAVQANLRYPASIASALIGADAAINLAGIQHQSGRQNFEAVHVFGARAIARAAIAEGVSVLVHGSGIGADADSPSAYIASKGRGEAALREVFPGAVILRPSVVFGPEDDFLNRFALLARYMPALPLFGGGATKMQPVYVGDIAEAAALTVEGHVKPGGTYEFGGPEAMTLREIVEFVCRTTDRRRALVPVPFGVASLMARSTEIASALSLGMFPAALTTTRDQIELLRHDNLVSPEAVADGRDFRGLGIIAQGVEAIAPAYLYRFRKTGQYAGAGLA
ncbi:complex I NDUFA9 subunit family protein [Methylocapsa sp. S129]|uniref:complex I NDUFA9 subunit family protein n=1 Tax=Methylocapsa sp. S129 TaxID=1641869 RepID=UPI00131A971A|nr:complex I NDUFA9 subunit family protein [Methylocapsa sp. S129]